MIEAKSAISSLPLSTIPKQWSLISNLVVEYLSNLVEQTDRLM